MAANHDLVELQKLHFESASKYVYFLLGATGAALGYALQKLDGRPPSLWVAPAVFSILCWLASFYAGCMRVTWTNRAMHAYFDSVQLARGVHPQQPEDQLQAEHAWTVRSQHSLENTSRASFYLKLQFWLLAVGLLAFVFWRLLEMARSAGAP